MRVAFPAVFAAGEDVGGCCCEGEDFLKGCWGGVGDCG